MDEENYPEEAPEARAFQAEVQQLLHILAHSLYTEKEIFLRELISNASDALHRLQFETLTNKDVRDPELELAVHLSFDAESKTLTVSDTGVGMTREELIENLGTIAHSGVKSFLHQLAEGERPADIIGQFGVGFYSAFMVAEEVTVTTLSFRPEATAWRWSSRGQDSYELEPAEKEGRGTTIELQLREEDAEFASAWRLEGVVKKHSDFISFPIYLEDRVINRQTALWRRQPREVEAGEYESFYKQFTLDAEEPLLHVHLATDVPVEIHALLLVPRRLERGMLTARSDHGLKLFTRNVLIQEYNKELLPDYLRFVDGVVDSADLPLNVSREAVQSNPVVRRIHRALTGAVLKELRRLSDESPEDYQLFWGEYRQFIKEGVALDPNRREDLVPLLRFTSTRSEGALTDLPACFERMAADQQALYYVLGEDLDSVARSPHLDYFRRNDLEVLYLVDPLDGFMIQSLGEYQGKPFQNVDQADLDLPEVEEAPVEDEPALPEQDFEGLLERMRGILGERVADVRASRLLTDSPSRLVSPETGPDRDLQRIRRLVEEDYEIPPRILEVNRTHPLIHNLAGLVRDQPEDPRIDLAVEQLFENLLLLEGLHPNPVKMVPRLQTLLEAATRG